MYLTCTVHILTGVSLKQCRLGLQTPLLLLHTHTHRHTHIQQTQIARSPLSPLSQSVWGGAVTLSLETVAGDCVTLATVQTQSPETHSLRFSLQPLLLLPLGEGGGGGRTTPSEPSPDSLAASFAASLFATGFRVAARAMEAGPRVSPGHFWQVELFSSYNRSLFLL